MAFSVPCDTNNTRFWKSAVIALIGKEFSPKGGSAPITRFFLGAFVMIGALVFLGCPLRMVLRIGGGDLNAVVGLVGFACGILGGIFFLNKGFSLKRTYKMTTSEAVTLPIGLALLFVLVLLVPSLFAASEEGPGSMHAPIIIALIAVSSLAAKTDVVTLRLRATVPPKTAVSFIDNDIKVDMNTENVAFQAFDESGNVISTDSSFIAESGTVRLSFTAA